MSSGTTKLLAGPAYISNGAANIYVPSSALIYGNIKQIHIANVTASAATFTLYIGGTGGSTPGTELESVYSIAAHGDFDRYFANLKLVSTTFLTGICETGSSKLTITVIGEEVVV